MRAHLVLFLLAVPALTAGCGWPGDDTVDCDHGPPNAVEQGELDSVLLPFQSAREGLLRWNAPAEIQMNRGTGAETPLRMVLVSRGTPYAYARNPELYCVRLRAPVTMLVSTADGALADVVEGSLSFFHESARGELALNLHEDSRRTGDLSLRPRNSALITSLTLMVDPLGMGAGRITAVVDRPDIRSVDIATWEVLKRSGFPEPSVAR